MLCSSRRLPWRLFGSSSARKHPSLQFYFIIKAVVCQYIRQCFYILCIYFILISFHAVRSPKRELTQGLRRRPSFVLSLHPYSLFFCKNVTRFLKNFFSFFQKAFGLLFFPPSITHAFLYFGRFFRSSLSLLGAKTLNTRTKTQKKSVRSLQNEQKVVYCSKFGRFRP